MSNIKYIIVSSPKYSIARESLVYSLKNNNIDIDDVFVVCNNSNDRFIDLKSTPTKIYLDLNLYEYSFFLGVSDLLDGGLVEKNNTFLLLHDTCMCGANFKKSVEEISNKYKHMDIIYSNNTGKFNIGIFRYKAIIYGSKVWSNITYLSKDEAIALEHGSSRELSPSRWVANGLKVFYPRHGSNFIGVKDVYEDGHVREISHVLFLDLYKYFYMVWDGFHPNSAG